jgi:hypothetical protein
LSPLPFGGGPKDYQKKILSGEKPLFSNGQLPLAQIGKGMDPGDFFQCINRGHAAAIKEMACFPLYGEVVEAKYHPSMSSNPFPPKKMKREYCGEAASPLVKNDGNRRWKSLPPQEDLRDFFFQVSAYPPST